MRAYDNNIWADRLLDEHKKSSKNSNLQKILLITCKNSSRKPLKSRVPRGYRRNESKPVEGIDTITLFIVFSFRNEVEMKVSPLRALTRAILLFFCLDTFFVEMKVSPLRALTHCYDGFSHVFKICRNGSKPVEGIDTFLRQFHSNGFCKTYRFE